MAFDSTAQASDIRMQPIRCPIIIKQYPPQPQLPMYKDSWPGLPHAYTSFLRTGKKKEQPKKVKQYNKSHCLQFKHFHLL